jgi:DNA-binding NarL/FixJ family response regulator
MPLLNGVDAAVQIKKSLPRMKLIFVTMHASTAYIQAVFEAGGTGYILKSGIREELLEPHARHGAAQSVVNGRIYVGPSLPTELRERFQDDQTPAATMPSDRAGVQDSAVHRLKETPTS